MPVSWCTYPECLDCCEGVCELVWGLAQDVGLPATLDDVPVSLQGSQDTKPSCKGNLLWHPQLSLAPTRSARCSESAEGCVCAHLVAVHGHIHAATA